MNKTINNFTKLQWYRKTKYDNFKIKTIARKNIVKNPETKPAIFKDTKNDLIQRKIMNEKSQIWSSLSEKIFGMEYVVLKVSKVSKA